tara:strand:- start:8 stop:280 length:273 start_codon:yes stop_codon:yes gene_type:complete
MIMPTRLLVHTRSSKMSRLKDIRDDLEALLAKVESHIGTEKNREVVLKDMSEALTFDLEERGVTFGPHMWGSVLKLVVMDDMLMDLKRSN